MPKVKKRPRVTGVRNAGTDRRAAPVKVPKKQAVAKKAAGRTTVATKKVATRKVVAKKVVAKKKVAPRKKVAAKKVIAKQVKKRAAPLPPVVQMFVKELDPQQKCGEQTSVQFLYRIDERVAGRSTFHLVFYDHHGWYCEHGRTCPAVMHARKFNGQLARA